MTSSADIHWTEVEEDLEDYVLHRLSAKRLEDFTAHLEVCTKCRARLKAEMKLVAAIRKHGSSDLKRRMLLQLQTTVRPRRSTRRVFTIAALIFATLTAGITAIWIMRQQTDQAIMEKEEIVQAPVSSASSEMEDTKQQEAPIAGERQRPLIRPKEPQAERAREMGTSAAKERDKLAETRSVRRPSIPSGYAGAAATEAAAQQRREGNRTFATSSADSGASVWIEGRVLETFQGGKEQQHIPIDLQQKGLSKKSEETLAGRSYDSTVAITPDAVISLQQRPISDLPRPQRSQYYSAGAASRVFTLLQKTPQGLKFTLYLEPLLDQFDIRRTHVQVAGTDSVILDVLRFRISYKLPPHWLLQQRQPAEH